MTDTDQKREDEVLKRMLAMPPKPHKEKAKPLSPLDKRQREKRNAEKLIESD